jgi:hypothetical protein
MKKEIGQMKNSYLMHDDDDNWFALLPNHQYKKIPYINWVEDIDWAVVYYQVYDSLLHDVISDLDLFNWPIEKILEVAADVKL